MAYTQREASANYAAAINNESSAALTSVIAGVVLALNHSTGRNGFEKLPLADIRAVLRGKAADMKKSTQYKRAEHAILVGREIVKAKLANDVFAAPTAADAAAAVARFLESKGIECLLQLEAYLHPSKAKSAEKSAAERIAAAIEKNVEEMQSDDIALIVKAIETGGTRAIKAFVIPLQAKLAELQAIAAAAETKAKAKTVTAKAQKAKAPKAKAQKATA